MFHAQACTEPFADQWRSQARAHALATRGCAPLVQVCIGADSIIIGHESGAKRYWKYYLRGCCFFLTCCQLMYSFPLFRPFIGHVITSVFTTIEFFYPTDNWSILNVSNSGIARTSPMLRHRMGTLHLCKILCKVEKYLRGPWACSSRNFGNFAVSQVGSEAVL